MAILIQRGLCFPLSDLSGCDRFQLARLPLCLGHSDLNVSVHPKQKRKQSVQRKTFQLATFEFRYIGLCCADQRRRLFLGQRAFFDALDDVQRKLGLCPVRFRVIESKIFEDIARTSRNCLAHVLASLLPSIASFNRLSIRHELNKP